ncbi:sulfurtransferase complex subunit TusC [Pasteurellaceae bacterium HPA106]|uniref:sulfurtransferase complex subunit TusC n=1 Tax=Spirabiliibacterium pneumoniae TaxID=221400 RepID=UPI001AADF17D|nr:sulfurtransferase complex subunit TusC [Spirabiliibacterium pneumoniae]MBE2897209.1 sulfurtransferase complex subunit TusC [Spirabiliibacterium pneumoniae]
MIKLAIVFTQSPFESAVSREGLDAALTATAFLEPDELAVFFQGRGVLNIKCGQMPNEIGQLDFLKRFKLLSLYEIEQCYVCADALSDCLLTSQDLLLDCQVLARADYTVKLQSAVKILTF